MYQLVGAIASIQADLDSDKNIISREACHLRTPVLSKCARTFWTLDVVFEKKEKRSVNWTQLCREKCCCVPDRE